MDAKELLNGKKTDGIVGFITSKRAISAAVGIVATLLASWKGIEIDPELRAQVVANIWKITLGLVGGFSLSDTFGKGKVAAEMRAAAAGLFKSGLDIASAVASKPKDGPDGGDPSTGGGDTPSQ